MDSINDDAQLQYCQCFYISRMCIFGKMNNADVANGCLVQILIIHLDTSGYFRLRRTRTWDMLIIDRPTAFTV